MIDAAILSALSPFLRQVVIMAGHHCPKATLAVLLMVATITLIVPLPCYTPCLVVVIPGTSTPDTSLLPHPSHIAMAGDVFETTQILKL